MALEDAIEKIERCLSSVKSYPEDIEEILTDDADDPTEAALAIRWDACDNDSDEEEDPRQKQNVVNASPSKKNKPDELETEHNGPASAKSPSIGLASRANQTSEGDAT